MFRRAVLMTAALLVFSASTLWARGWSIEVFGGGAMPTGDFQDHGAGTGYQFGGAVDYAVNDRWTFGVDASATHNAHRAEGKTYDLGGGNSYTTDSYQFTTRQYGVHTRLALPGSGPLRYHGLLGVGAFWNEEAVKVTFNAGGDSTVVVGDGSSEDIQRGLCARLGAGAMYAMGASWAIGVDVDYMFPFDEDEFGTKSFQFFGLKGVLRYTLGTSRGR